MCKCNPYCPCCHLSVLSLVDSAGCATGHMFLSKGYVRSTQHHMQHQVDNMDSLKAYSWLSNFLIFFHLFVVCLSLTYRTAHSDRLVTTGVHYDSVSEQYQVGVTARKNFQLGSSETWLKLSQDALYNPQTQKVHRQPCWYKMSGT